MTVIPMSPGIRVAAYADVIHARRLVLVIGSGRSGCGVAVGTECALALPAVGRVVLDVHHPCAHRVGIAGLDDPDGRCTGRSSTR